MGNVTFRANPLPPEDEPWPEPRPHEPRDSHCGVGGKPKPGHAEYRRCRCGQWYWWSGSLWRPVNHPPQKWLREHGLGGDAEDFWISGGGDDERGSVFGEFFTTVGGWRYALRALMRWLVGRQ